MLCLIHAEDFALPARHRKQPRPINHNYLNQQFISVVYNSDNIQIELEFIIILKHKGKVVQSPVSNWFIVPVNSWKNRMSSELLYKSNRPQVSMV